MAKNHSRPIGIEVSTSNTGVKDYTVLGVSPSTSRCIIDILTQAYPKLFSGDANFNTEFDMSPSISRCIIDILANVYPEIISGESTSNTELQGIESEESSSNNELQEIKWEPSEESNYDTAEDSNYDTAEESSSDNELQEIKSEQSEESTCDTELIRPTLPSLSRSTSLFIETLATLVEEIKCEVSTYDTEHIRPTLPSCSVENILATEPPELSPSDFGNMSPSAIKRYSQIYASAAQYDRWLKVPSYLIESSMDRTRKLHQRVLASICVLQDSLDRHLSDTTMRVGGDGLSSSPTDINAQHAEIESLCQCIEGELETSRKQHLRLLVEIAETLRSNWKSGRREGMATIEPCMVNSGPLALTKLSGLVWIFCHREDKIMEIWEPIAKTVADALDEKFWAQGDRILGL